MRAVTVISCLALGLLVAAMARGQAAPKPLAADVVVAWEKAGAEFGWMSPGHAYSAETDPPLP
jgi:hypothetical protein